MQALHSIAEANETLSLYTGSNHRHCYPLPPLSLAPSSSSSLFLTIKACVCCWLSTSDRYNNNNNRTRPCKKEKQQHIFGFSESETYFDNMFIIISGAMACRWLRRLAEGLCESEVSHPWPLCVPPHVALQNAHRTTFKSPTHCIAGLALSPD